jgi:pilin isopeptide linkage protein
MFTHTELLVSFENAGVPSHYVTGKGDCTMCSCSALKQMKTNARTWVWTLSGLLVVLTVCLAPIAFPVCAHAAESIPRSSLRLTDKAGTAAGAGNDSLEYLLEHYALFSFGNVSRAWATNGAVAVRGDFSADEVNDFGKGSRDGIHSFIRGRLINMKPANSLVPTVFLDESKNTVSSDGGQVRTYTVNSKSWHTGDRLAFNNDYIDFGHAAVRVSAQSEALAQKSTLLTLDPTAPDGLTSQESADSSRFAGVSYKRGILNVPVGSHFRLSLDDFNHVTNVNIVRGLASATSVPATVISVSDSGEAHLPTVMVDGSHVSSGGSEIPALVWNLPAVDRVVSAGGFNPYGLPLSWELDKSKPAPKWVWFGGTEGTETYSYDESGALVAPQAHFVQQNTWCKAYGPLVVASADLNGISMPGNSQKFDFKGDDDPGDDPHPHPDPGHDPDPDPIFVIEPGFISFVAHKHVNSAEPAENEHFWFASDYYDPDSSAWATTYTRNTNEKDTSKGGSSVRFEKLPIREGKSWFGLREILPGEDQQHPEPDGYQYDSHMYWVSYETDKQEINSVLLASGNFTVLASGSFASSSPVVTRVKRTVYSEDCHRADLTHVKHSDGSIDTANLHELSHETGLIDSEGNYVAIESSTAPHTGSFAVLTSSKTATDETSHENALDSSHSEDERVTFNNTTVSSPTVSPTRYPLPLQKRLIGGELKGNDFHFDITGTDASSAATIADSGKRVSNGRSASGSSVRGTAEQCQSAGTEDCTISVASAQFQMTFSQSGTYHYRISEETTSIVQPSARVSYDTAVFDVTVQVNQSGSQLQVTQPVIQKRTTSESTAVSAEKVVFTNVLRSEPRTVLPKTGGVGLLSRVVVPGASLVTGCSLAFLARRIPVRRVRSGSGNRKNHDDDQDVWQGAMGESLTLLGRSHHGRHRL